MQVAFNLFLLSLELTTVALTLYGGVKLNGVNRARLKREQGRCYLFNQSQPCTDCLFQVKVIQDGTLRILQAAFSLDFVFVYGETVIEPVQYFGCCVQHGGLDCCKYFNSETNDFCDNWGNLYSGCHSGLWPCSFLFDGDGHPTDVRAEYFNFNAVKLLIAVSTVCFVFLLHLHYQVVRNFSIKVATFICTNPFTETFVRALKFLLLIPYYLLIAAIPQSLIQWFKRSNSTTLPCVPDEMENGLDTRPAHSVAQAKVTSKSARQTQDILLKSRMSVGDVDTYPIKVELPGSVADGTVSPLPSSELSRRREILNSRTPALPPPEPQTYARRIELPSPPRVAGRPRERKTADHTRWWGSGLPN